MGLKFSEEKEGFLIVLHVQPGQEKALDWKLPLPPIPDTAQSAYTREQAYFDEPQFAQSAYAEESPESEQLEETEETDTIRQRLSNWREVRTLVRDGKTGDALSLALKLAETYDRKRLQNSLILLQSRQNRLNNQRRLGTISEADANLEQNKITASLLELVNDEGQDEYSEGEANIAL